MESPLDAAATGDLAALQRAVAVLDDVSARMDSTDMGDTLLTWAARHGQAEAMRYLLGRGADVNGTTDLGGSALLIACQENHVE